MRDLAKSVSLDQCMMCLEESWAEPACHLLAWYAVQLLAISESRLVGRPVEGLVNYSFNVLRSGHIFYFFDLQKCLSEHNILGVNAFLIWKAATNNHDPKTAPKAAS